MYSFCTGGCYSHAPEPCCKLVRREKGEPCAGHNDCCSLFHLNYYRHRLVYHFPDGTYSRGFSTNESKIRKVVSQCAAIFKQRSKYQYSKTKRPDRKSEREHGAGAWKACGKR